MASPNRHPHFDTNESWLTALQGAERSAALKSLRPVLMRGLRASLAARGAPQAAALAEDFTQEALLKILDSLDTFRGESRFTTWAQKIAIRLALTELRRKRWQDVSIQDLTGENENSPASTNVALSDPMPDPASATALRMLVERIEHIMKDDLTDRQQVALNAVMKHGMPLEEVARRMETNRNALYKLLHDARKRLQQGLEKRGINIGELLELN